MTKDVDLRHLQGILGKSKMVMDKTATVSGNRNVTNESFDYDEEKPLPDMNTMLRERGIKTKVKLPEEINGANYEQSIEESNLPPHIKKLMKEQPIDTSYPISNNGGLSEDFINSINPKRKVIKEQASDQQKTQPQQPQINYSKEEMKGMIKEVLSEMMLDRISETTIKKTLQKMVTEGRLRIKK